MEMKPQPGQSCRSSEGARPRGGAPASSGAPDAALLPLPSTPRAGSRKVTPTLRRRLAPPPPGTTSDAGPSEEVMPREVMPMTSVALKDNRGRHGGNRGHHGWITARWQFEQFGLTRTLSAWQSDSSSQEGCTSCMSACMADRPHSQGQVLARVASECMHGMAECVGENECLHGRAGVRT